MIAKGHIQMSKKIDQFAIYAAKIFEIMYDSFPIPSSLNRSKIISEYLSIEPRGELNALRNKIYVADMTALTKEEKEPIQKAIKELPDNKKRMAEIEEKQRIDRHLQERIYEGTIEFLVFEGLLRKCEAEEYQLTSKGFSHLNKEFKDGKISETHIANFRNVLKKSSNMSLQVATGTAVNVVTSMLGYG
jgi:DNA-binding helix-hairpin-helix protein with protein kinase domain